jgi:thioredoxin-like negative regulator of GroEL
MVEINDSQFNTLVLRSALPVLIECSSPECIICKSMAERIKEASKDFISRMVFFRLNINENNKWKDFNVRVIPTLLYFKDGILVARQDSFPETREILDQIRNVCTERKRPRFLRLFKKKGAAHSKY